jgi:hypothetical protein
MTTHANILYGNARPEPATPVQQAPTSEQRLAATLYGTPDPAKPEAQAPATPTATDPVAEDKAGAQPAAQSLYEPDDKPLDDQQRAAAESTYGSAMRTAKSELVERAGWDVGEAHASAAAAGELFYRHGVSSDDAQHVTEAAISAEVNGVTDEQMAEWRTRSYGALRADWGASADQMLADARALVKTDPRLHDYLHSTGLGNHPAVVRVIANRARQLRSQGKL